MTKAFDLMPRLISNNERQIKYYEKQLEITRRDLGRLMMISSGQLMLWDEPVILTERTANYGYIEGESKDRPGRPPVQPVGEES